MGHDAVDVPTTGLDQYDTSQFVSQLDAHMENFDTDASHSEQAMGSDDEKSVSTPEKNKPLFISGVAMQHAHAASQGSHLILEITCMQGAHSSL